MSFFVFGFLFQSIYGMMLCTKKRIVHTETHSTDFEILQGLFLIESEKFEMLSVDGKEEMALLFYLHMIDIYWIDATSSNFT
jgi:hypothetical protein